MKYFSTSITVMTLPLSYMHCGDGRIVIFHRFFKDFDELIDTIFNQL